MMETQGQMGTGLSLRNTLGLLGWGQIPIRTHGSSHVAGWGGVSDSTEGAELALGWRFNSFPHP